MRCYKLDVCTYVVTNLMCCYKFDVLKKREKQAVICYFKKFKKHMTELKIKRVETFLQYIIRLLDVLKRLLLLLKSDF